MGITICYLIVVLFVGLVPKNNKASNLLLAITLYILLAFEHSDQDYVNYVQAYDAVGNGSVFELLGYEPSFFLFCTLGNNYGLTFDVARSIVCVIEVLAIISTIRVFSSQVACILALFIIFPATADAELFRWLGGMSLVIFAFPYLIRGESKRDYIIYSVLVVLATTIHTSCIFFMVYNLLYLQDKYKITIIVLAAFIILFATAQTSLLYKILAYLPIQDSLNDKFQMTGQSNIFGLMAITFREFFVFLIGYLSYRRYKRYTLSLQFIDGRFSFKRKKYTQYQMGWLLCSKLLNINIISTLLVAIAIYTPLVQRLFHVLLFFNTIAAMHIAFVSKSNRLKWFAFICVVLTLMLHLFNGPQNMEIFMSHFNEGFLVNFIDVCFEGKQF